MEPEKIYAHKHRKMVGKETACARAREKEFSKLETQNTNHSCGKEQLYWILMIQELQDECQ